MKINQNISVHYVESHSKHCRMRKICSNANLTFTSCSITCYKTHKEKHEEARNESIRDTKQASPVQASKNDQSINMSPSNLLISNEALTMLFQKYPDLKNRLHAIYSITQEPPLTGMGECSERDFNKNRTKSPWTQERADQRALQALHQELTNRDGEGIREFALLMNTSQLNQS